MHVSSNTSLSPNILADFSQFFSILSDLKCYRSASQALQIIFEMQSQRSNQKRSVKKIRFFELQNTFFFSFLHFDPSYFISA